MEALSWFIHACTDQLCHFSKGKKQSKTRGVGTERGKGGEKDGCDEGSEEKMNVSQVEMDFKMLPWAMPAQLKTLGYVPGK